MSGTGAAYSSVAHELAPVVSVVRVSRYLVFCVIFCISLFFLKFSISWWPLYCLTFFN